MIMNYYRRVDRQQYQFDFVVHDTHKGFYDDEIRELGGRIYYTPSLGTVGPIRYVRKLTHLIREKKPFCAVHAHMDFQTGFAALAAKMAGVSIRICHSHTSAWKTTQNAGERMVLLFCRFMANRYCTERFACSTGAADFLFGSKTRQKEQITYITNGVALEKYGEVYAMEQKEVRNHLGLRTDCAIIGHVGRYLPVKNHKFILQLVESLCKVRKDFQVVFVGDGPLMHDTLKEIEQMGLSSFVLPVGITSEVHLYMRAFDLFLLPSIFEGMPLVLIEAQAAGLPCLVSDAITQDADMGLELLKYCSLNDLNHWVDYMDQILSQTKARIPWSVIQQSVEEKGFSVAQNVCQLIDVYKKGAVS